MNIPAIYLTEPYNAYAPKGRKKHWHEIVEEQALMARILAEQQALQEAQKSKTLPPDAPATATPTIGGTPQAGGGGVPPPQFFHPESDVIDFSFTPTNGAAPLTIAFTNLTTTPQFDSYLWEFGDGVTSTEASPSHVYDSGSADPTYLTASLQVTNSITGVPGGRKEYYLTVSVPVVTSNFTFTTESNVAPFTASFVNTSTNTSQTPTTNYTWIIQNGGITTVSNATNLTLRIDSGSFTASLAATGSYGIGSVTSSQHLAPAPTLTLTFADVASGSNVAPTWARLGSTASYNGIGTLTGTWRRGEYHEDGTTEYQSSYTQAQPSIGAQTYDTRSATGQDGHFTASLGITESIYGIKASVTASFALAIPTVAAIFSVSGSSVSYLDGYYTASAADVLTFNNASTTTNTAVLTYNWLFLSGSVPADYPQSIATDTSLAFIDAGDYLVKLSASGSYGITNTGTRKIQVVP